MSHELTTRKSGRVEMAFVGETPWHGLGQRLEEGADIETWTTAAGMDWKLQRSKVRFHFGEGHQEYACWDDNHVLFRSDTKAPLGLVSKDYKTVQPRQVLEFFRDLVDANGYSLHTAGTLFGGKRFWALARVASDVSIVGDDRVGGFLLLSSSCDGTARTEARETTVRVVCNNTLTMAVRSKPAAVAVSHRSKFDADAVKARLGLARENFNKFVEAAKVLSSVKMGGRKAEDFLASLLRDTGAVTAKEVEKTEAFGKILALFDGSAMGGRLAGARGTAWGVVNAVTEYVDHGRAKTADSRLLSAWFGPGEQLKAEAFRRALELS